MKKLILSMMALAAITTANALETTQKNDTVVVVKTIVVNTNGEVVSTSETTPVDAPVKVETKKPSVVSYAGEVLPGSDTHTEVMQPTDTTKVERNLWHAKMRASNFHLGLSMQTKYMWRGMEMMTEEAAPVLFPTVYYDYNGLNIYAMGGYALNGKYAEVDLGASYTWHGLTVGFNDYYYPTVNSSQDKYFGGGKNTGHWLEAVVTYAPTFAPIWVTVSNFFYGADKYKVENGEMKQAYSTYLELGAYYDFLKSNQIMLTVGAACNKSCYNDYSKGFSICNIEAKYTYTCHFKNDFTLPLSAALIYVPTRDKMYFNFTASFNL